MFYPYDPIWKNNPSLRTLFLALAPSLEQSDTLVRFAGGCVRDLLQKKTPTDYDLATVLTPEAVMAHLKRKNISFITPGLAHGTVTALLDDQPFEITTLRKDLTPDGRHTTVGYINDWSQDAQRRDFTINGLFMDWMGQLYDYVGGIQDLKNKKVTFIGNPETRIEEDYLRLLRWFRMNARFGTPTLPESLNTLFQRYGPCIQNLSLERKREEFFKILTSPHLYNTLTLMRVSGILDFIAPSLQIPHFLDKVISLQTHLTHTPNPYFILSLLLKHTTQEQLSESLSYFKLSKKQTLFIKNFLKESQNLTPQLTEKDLAIMAFSLEKSIFEGLMLLKVVTQSPQASLEVQGQQLQTLCSLGEMIRSTLSFPLTGQDLIDAQLTPGPHFKKLLHATQTFWLNSTPRPGKPECLAFLKKLYFTRGPLQ